MDTSVTSDRHRQERAKLFGWIREFLDSKIGLDDFHRQFYFYFVEELEDDSLDEPDWRFFEVIQEKLDFVSESPDTESRRYGWISDEDFRKWLCAYVE